MKYLLATILLSTSLQVQADSLQFRNDYELVSAGASEQALGPVGGKGDILDRVVIIPETTAAGTVAIKDGGGTAINIFVSGTLSDLHPIIVELNLRSRSGAWQITTGTNVHAIGIGKFK